MTNPSTPTFPIFVVGLPGSGKSKVGKLLSKHLGIKHVDSDAVIEEQQGRTIGEIFDTDGESHFRDLERSVVLSMADEPAIVSLGGGAIESESLQDLLKTRKVVWIRAEERVLLHRIRRSSRRPLMKQDPKGTLRKLAKRREPLYMQVADIEVWSTSSPPQKVVDQILEELSQATEVTVYGSNVYQVLIGQDLSGQTADLVPIEATRIFFVYPETLGFLVDPIVSSVAKTGRSIFRFPHPPSESAKSYEVVVRGWEQMGSNRIGRRDAVVCIGGGATTDMGGFLASSWLRGVSNINVPTTVLGMVDAAVGGKTGINTGSGKNLVGAFHDPIAVICDTDFLATLPVEEYRSGLAEIIKCGFISDPEILKQFRDHPELADLSWATTDGVDILNDIIVRAIKVKAKVVSNDRLESGIREFLNYGHTLGHAIEKREDYEVRHGEAVSIGAIFAAQLAFDQGKLTQDELQLHRDLFSSMGLPIDYHGDFHELVSFMKSDKKVRAGQLRFVLLDGIGNPVVVQVEEDQLLSAAREMGISTDE